MTEPSSRKQSSTNSDASSEGFSEEERAAMKARAAELRAEKLTPRGVKKAEAEAEAVHEKIASMPESDRELAQGVYDLVLAAAPELAPKLWYGQPAYALDGTVICFFRSGLGDKERYSTFGVSSAANLDDDTGLWATGFALTALTPAAKQQITALVTKAVSKR
ncbi:DUF1801 domain-containing protein [Humidisolicoccus flavus]|uniref:DUF1801 domain-containing protein n=1 Tax=Humidisolicoccus flavus TaxID=3111414 RepID=UPI003255E68C